MKPSIQMKHCSFIKKRVYKLNNKEILTIIDVKVILSDPNKW